MEPFKNLINAETVRRSAHHLRRASKSFDARRFERLALDGLDELELKQRVAHLCTALEACLPDDFERAARIVEASLKPVGHDDPLPSQRTNDEGLAGWITWSMGEFVVRRGMETPERALETLRAITQRGTAEFAVRPFLVRHPELGFATLERWTRDPSAHVRRLVSEGSRPRLPWGLQLKALIADPSPTLPLLRALQDDRSEYVRRSVANHLNDIAKDHPERVVAWVEEHLATATDERRRLLERASRTLIKRGSARMLRAWGLGARFRGTSSISLAPRNVRVGDSLILSIDLHSTARAAQPLLIDYTVHHVRADGSRSPKVFKGWKFELAPRAKITLTKSHSMRPVTTRNYYPGTHRIEVSINGAVVGGADFALRLK